mmetsp:Transcript_55696/g.132800  ORF Transcript_55696/g.132800 Transcript_55696/m.132800 type:complete len:155 (+) Transcript_55696:303-767(+)
MSNAGFAALGATSLTPGVAGSAADSEVAGRAGGVGVTGVLDKVLLLYGNPDPIGVVGRACWDLFSRGGAKSRTQPAAPLLGMEELQLPFTAELWACSLSSCGEQAVEPLLRPRSPRRDPPTSGAAGEGASDACGNGSLPCGRSLAKGSGGRLST